jgi:prepilin-type N-terminal cleavage/methylation domain-containing protein
MRRNEGGFTLIEIAVAVSLSAILAAAGAAFTFHALHTSAQNGAHLTALSNVQNAGYWISRDASMADNVITDNITSPTLLVLLWTDWGYDTNNVYWAVSYSVDNVTGGIGQLNRWFQSSTGIDQKTVVAENVYYDPADPDNSTGISYENRVIKLRVVTRSGDVIETRTYDTYRRPNF